MTFWNLDTLDLEAFRPGIMSKAEMGNTLMMVCMQIDPGKKDVGHVHLFDQCGIVMDGPIEMFVDMDRRVLNANDCYFIPSGKRHGWETFDKPVRLLDVSCQSFTPVQEQETIK
ncbi:MAG: cupin domain-containing protein [Proteobacteria bacterium]|nr:cupin domain-containing protein [Desulfobacula sp.]MBU3950774.1 cupin domain-containing protein [Pseudomonadota bacterium]MBU4133030.1 cupin domain-containing protein [Pseudomonadota bacterium]